MLRARGPEDPAHAHDPGQGIGDRAVAPRGERLVLDELPVDEMHPTHGRMVAQDDGGPVVDGAGVDGLPPRFPDLVARSPVEGRQARRVHTALPELEGTNGRVVRRDPVQGGVAGLARHRLGPPREQLIQPAHRLQDLGEAWRRLDVIAPERLEHAMVPGDREGGRERPGRGRAEQHQVVDELTGQSRPEELDRPPRHQ